MSTLRSGLDEYRSSSLSSCSDATIEADVAEIKTAIRSLEVECARRIAELERRRSFERDGHLSIASWVESRFGETWSQAAREVRLARGLDQLPDVRAALSGGDMATSAALTLVAARETDPEAFDRSADALLEAAMRLPARGLRMAVEHWRSETDRERVLREDAERFERRGLNAKPTADGMVRVDGILVPETGGSFLTALRSITDHWARSRDDARSPAQRRADALGEMCRRWLHDPDRPSIAGERPHVTVVVDLETLETASAADSARPKRSSNGMTQASGNSTSEGIRLPGAAVRRLACDAAVSRVVVSGRSEPLDVGRTARVVPSSLRRALAVRDGGCAFPTCDRPVGWCDAHHVRHWADGGSTELSNLVLLCRRHHTVTHDGFRIEVLDGHPVFRRPDGTLIAARAGPRAGTRRSAPDVAVGTG
jgi:hypothetical protein